MDFLTKKKEVQFYGKKNVGKKSKRFPMDYFY